MAELFSEDWMKGFMNAWNGDPELTGALEKISFSSVIAYGMDDEEEPRGYIKVENGRGVEAGSYSGGEVNWDLRAGQGQWEKWITKPPGMVALGMAYTSRKLKFKVGDYTAMIKDPRMAGPFIKSFSAMSKAA